MSRMYSRCSWDAATNHDVQHGKYVWKVSQMDKQIQGESVAYKNICPPTSRVSRLLLCWGSERSGMYDSIYYSEPLLQRQHLFPKMLPLKWICCCKEFLMSRMICKKGIVLYIFPHRTNICICQNCHFEAVLTNIWNICYLKYYIKLSCVISE